MNVKYTDNNGNEVELTTEIVKKYMVSGCAEKVTDQEIATFIKTCEYGKLNPWLKECYLIRSEYGNKPAQIVSAKDGFLKRAEVHPEFDGYSAGIVLLNAQGALSYREGMITGPNEQLLGGWAEVWRKDRAHSYRVEVPYAEYVQRKADGCPTQQWAGKPGTMIRKVALTQALREAFPSANAGLYDVAEDAPEMEVEPVLATEDAIGELKKRIKEDGYLPSQILAALKAEGRIIRSIDRMNDEEYEAVVNYLTAAEEQAIEEKAAEKRPEKKAEPAKKAEAVKPEKPKAEKKEEPKKEAESPAKAKDAPKAERFMTDQMVMDLTSKITLEGLTVPQVLKGVCKRYKPEVETPLELSREQYDAIIEMLDNRKKARLKSA